MRHMVAALAAAVILLCVPAVAQSGGPKCRADRDAAIQFIQEQYGEVPVVVALTSGGALLDVLATPDGSTWTILITTRDRGQTCIVSEGDNWRPVAAVMPGQGA